MYVITGGGRIKRLKRRPANWDALECWHDYHFIPENRSWDADEVERVVRAIGIYDVYPNSAYLSEDRWLKKITRDFCNTGRLRL
jgi:hypothetical protein